VRTARTAAVAAAASLFVAAFAASARPDAADDLRTRRADIVSRAPKLEKADVARERYALGLWARERGLQAEASEEFRAALAADPDHEPAHAALGDVRVGNRWVAHDEAMAAKGLVRRGDLWVLREEAEILDLPAREREVRREQHAKVDKLLRAYASGSAPQRKFALEALGTVEDRHKLEPMAYGLRSKSGDVRLLAAQELGRLGNRRALKPLVRRAVNDPVASVREASVDAAKAIGDANLVAPFVTALGSEDANTRIRAADAIARLGDVRGIRYLVWKFEAHGGGGPRAYSFFANQLTYIQDFDVEVAQTAFIADPIVGILQDGIVIDVQVVGTEQVSIWTERQAFHSALQRLTGATNVKNETGAWAKWWKEHEAELTAAK